MTALKPATLLAALLLACSVYAQQPVLKITGKDSARVRLSTYTLDVKVVGNTSITTMQMKFCNSSPRILEGELNFPMPDGVSISRYAIDINGKMREAVPVEKEKGQVVFENIERRNVDPGLLEKTEGNNFRTRIYPIPANGCRTVIIAYEQELKMTSNSSLQYSLPLHFKEPIDNFNISFKIYSTTAPEVGSDCSTDMKFSEMKNVYVTETKKQHFKPDGSFSIIIPKFADASEVLIQQANNQNYFLINSYPEAKSIEKKIPDQVTIIWDNSFSGLNRDHKKEFELLDKYFQRSKTIEVHLQTIGYSYMNQATYLIRNGGWSELKTKLENMVYDGATDFSTLSYISPGDEYLFFTDGLNTYGNIANMTYATKPVSTINASPNADYPLLKYIAARTGGVFINLNESTVDAGIDLLTKQQLQFLGIKNESNVSSVYPSVITPLSGSLSAAGILLGDKASITLQFGYGKTVLLEKTLQLDLAAQKTTYIDIEKIWAQKRIAELEMEYDLHKDLITEIGKKYGLVTRNTSLIVLDAVEDYVQYEIEPPAELKPAYTRLMVLKERKEKLKDRRSIDEAAKYYGELTTWWNKKYFPKSAIKKQSINNLPVDSMQVVSPSALNGDALIVPVYDTLGNIIHGMPGSPNVRPSQRPVEARAISLGALSYSTSANFSTSAYLNTFSTGSGDRRVLRNGSWRDVGALTSAVPFLRISPDARSAAYQWSADSVRLNYKRDSLGEFISSDTTADVDINMADVVPDRPYLKQLDSASKENLYKKYLDIRVDYLEDPVFFFDVCKRFAANGDTATALKVLSNIADMNFDDHELYKMLGYELKALREFAKEVYVYRKVLEWRPQEPQSYRDYALALQDDGKYQQALDTLYLSLTKNFDQEISSLYPGIEEISCTEINELVAAHSNLDLSKIDKRIIKQLPVDIRVVLNWNMNATDIDLWVFDPNGEQCYYSNRFTQIGGRISRDFTRGYGPEQFMLKKALKGKYTVKLNYYGDSQQKIAGPTTVMAEIFTNFGKPNQQRRTIALQMQKGANGEVMVGEFEF